MDTAILPDSTRFSFIPELDDTFLKLFSHRHDYIWAKHSHTAIWQTESRHPLSDRLIKQGAFSMAFALGLKLTKSSSTSITAVSIIQRVTPLPLIAS